MGIEEKAKQAAESEENKAERDLNQRIGVDDDQPAQNSETKDGPRRQGDLEESQ